MLYVLGLAASASNDKFDEFGVIYELPNGFRVGTGGVEAEQLLGGSISQYESVKGIGNDNGVANTVYDFFDTAFLLLQKLKLQCQAAVLVFNFIGSFSVISCEPDNRVGERAYERGGFHFDPAKFFVFEHINKPAQGGHNAGAVEGKAQQGC